MTDPITRSRLALALVVSLLLHLLLAGGLGGFDHEREFSSQPLIHAVLIAPPAQPEPVSAEPPPVTAEAPQPVPRPAPAPSGTATPDVADDRPATPVSAAPQPSAPEASSNLGDAAEERDQDYGEEGPPVIDYGQTLTPMQALIGEARLEFDVYRGESLLIGQTRYHWVHDGERYQMDVVTETTGLAGLLRPLRIEQRSIGDMTDRGLRPTRFESIPKEGKANDEEVIFDWASSRVMLRAGKTRSEHALLDGAQDMASLWLEIIWRTQAGGDFDFTVATGKRYTPRWFIPEQESGSLDTAIGRLLVKRLHTRAQPGDNQIEVWLAPNLRWLPVRIRYTDRKGDVYDQRVRLIEYENQRLQAQAAMATPAAPGTANEPPTEPANPFLR